MFAGAATMGSRLVLFPVRPRTIWQATAEAVMKAISYLIRAGVVAGVGVALPFTALADDLASVSNNAQTSVTIGFSGISLPLLSRVSVADPTPALLAQVCPAPCQAAAPASHNALTRISGPTWHLDVSVDGTWARFEDLSVRGR